MKLKNLILTALLLAIGMMLHQFAPPIFGMKPDFLLSMMFIAILFNEDYKTTFIIGLTSGILTAATTTFPGGQLPNLIDKIITSQTIYIIIILLGKTNFIFKTNNTLKLAIVSILGTVISGTVFLGSANLLFSLPAPFKILFLTVVLPATLINTAASLLLFNVINIAAKRSGLSKIMEK